MAIPPAWQELLQLPVVSAPMFIISGPELVAACCKEGILGTFPALNQRSSEGFEEWLVSLKADLASFEASTGKKAAPFGVNLIVHKTNPRVEADLRLCVKHQVPLVITSLGAVAEVVQAVHSYGGKVFHDVTNLRHAKKAIAAGVDGLIAVCAGAGGHAGTMSPFALLSELRAIFDGTLLLAGCLSKGEHILAAKAMGADLAYMGTRFINTEESRASQPNKEMIQASSAEDIFYTPAISGVPANFLKASILQAGLDPDRLPTKTSIDVTEELIQPKDGKKPWKDIWSAGQGVGSITDSPSVAELAQRLKAEYQAAKSRL